MANLVQKSFKIPEEWAQEINRQIGRKMVETGGEMNFASFMKEKLDEGCDLTRITGVDSDGEPVAEHGTVSSPVAKPA